MPRGAVLEPGGAVLACVLLMEQADLLLEGKKNLLDTPVTQQKVCLRMAN